MLYILLNQNPTDTYSKSREYIFLPCDETNRRNLFTGTFELFRNCFANCNKYFMESNCPYNMILGKVAWKTFLIGDCLELNSQFSAFVLLFFCESNLENARDLNLVWKQHLTSCFMLACTSSGNSHGPLWVMAHQIVLRYPVDSVCLFGISSYLFVYKIIQHELKL